LRVVVAGMIAGDPYQGGAAWTVLQYVYGLERLGHEVTLVEPLREQPSNETMAFFRLATAGLDARLLHSGEQLTTRADLLLDVSGLLRDYDAAPLRVYLDLDPVFSQLWHLQGIDVGIAGHTHHVTVGRNVPDTGHEWLTTVPPVVLERWPAAGSIELDALTTVANFRGYGTLELEGVRYGQKVHSLRGIVDLPRRTDERIAIAMDVHEDEPDLAVLRDHGWQLLDPRQVAGTPDAYARFIRGSKAELGIAKEGYVVSRSGWFSDRSACYLASGRPVIGQDTGFGDYLPTGAGLFAFDAVDDVLAAIDELRGDYGRHARAARAIAEEFLDSDRVLTRLLQAVGAAPATTVQLLHDVDDYELARLLNADSVRRRPSPYRSSFPLAELDVTWADGVHAELIGKELTAEARAATKPAYARDPDREPAAYRLLEPEGLGPPRFYGTHAGLLLIERVPGIELYQVGDVATWQRVARWLAALHERFKGRKLGPPLLSYSGDLLKLWAERARTLTGVELDGYDEAVDLLEALPRTLVHGELYPSNVLVTDDRVAAVDWEMAGAGPGVLDLAALVTGWPEDDSALLVEAYGDVDPRDIAAAQLALAARWLGWSSAWTPPPEHAHDWVEEARRAAAALR
jgi:Phosphotransferase enzyme family